MKLKTLIYTWFCFLPASLFAQHEITPRLILELSSGADLGWWLYQKGSVNSFLDQGQDYTHHSATIGIELDLLYRLGRWRLGLGMSYGGFFEDEMNGTRNSEFVVDEYLITEGAAVQFFRYNLQAEYILIQKNKFSLGPQIKYGWFEINTSHPEKENFGYRSYWEVGLQHEFKLKKIYLFFRPKYQVSTILPKEEKQPEEKHKIYGIGLQIGLRIGIR
ncbi:MAG: hypothetical protein NW226_07660 [Microscillaceae bacterium]|nr:hypothetical protein [Microscillaceae bacterium]